MSPLEHTLLSALYYDYTDFIKRIGYILLPDAIRAYTGKRQYSHFEKSSDGGDTSWMVFPTDLKSLSREYMGAWMKENSHLASNIRVCAVGEQTSISKFLETNAKPLLQQKNGIYVLEGVMLHLVQDVALDAFAREVMDCSDRYNGNYYVNGCNLDSKGCREFIYNFEQQGAYYLAGRLYFEKGIVANNEWFRSVVFSALERLYSPDLAANTCKYILIKPVIDKLITRKNFSMVSRVGPLEESVVSGFYGGLVYGY